MSLCSQQQGLGVSPAFQSQPLQAREYLTHYEDEPCLRHSHPKLPSMYEDDYKNYLVKKNIPGGTYSFRSSEVDPVTPMPDYSVLSESNLVAHPVVPSVDFTSLIKRIPDYEAPKLSDITEQPWYQKMLKEGEDILTQARLDLDNIHVDRPHAGKPAHLDFTRKKLDFLGTLGADKVEVDYDGDIIGGSSQIGKFKFDWE